MIVSLEYLYHYRCDDCQKWWTIADLQPKIKQTIHCPHCGYKNKVNGIESHYKPKQVLLPVVSHKCTTTHSACDCVLEQLKDREDDLRFEYNSRIAAEKAVEELSRKL